jgi:glycosyltransferase involved in cell wall biosynthesis
MMNIGYFITKYPYDRQIEQYPFGGASVAARGLASHMAKRGHEITVFTTSVNAKNTNEIDKDIRIYRYGTNVKLLTSNISWGMFRNPLRHDLDIAHTHFDIPPGPLSGLLYAKKKKVPLIITYHGDWIGEYGGAIRRIGVSFHNRYVVDKILSYADGIISPSYYYINESKFLKKYKEKINVIPNGINIDNFSVPYSKEECKSILGLPRDKNILLFFGYLSPYKGPDILLKAMPRVIKDIQDVLLIVSGIGSMKDELMSLSKRLNINNNVKFTGYIDESLKPIYFKAADVFCLPSVMTTESFGIVNLEAMACGVPVVASKIGGIPDVIRDGENGLLVAPSNPELLADALIHLFKNEDIRRKMGERALELVEYYSWDRIAIETEKVYSSVIGV